MRAALDGIRVLDLTEALAGPYCTMVLGDLGADVIKVERPGSGDQSRRWGPPFVGTESAYFLAVNRNKRSAALDVKSSHGRWVMRRLLEAADVFVCNVRRPESLRGLGLDPESALELNPRLVYCAITAYGRTGPYAGRGGYDVVAQGEAGLMAATGPVDGEPVRWPVAIADLSSGLWSAAAVLAALYARERTGRGQLVDQALLDGQLSWAAVMASQCLASDRRPVRLGNLHANIVPYQVFKARDRYVIAAVGTEAHWQRFCGALELGEHVRDDPRFATNTDRLRHRGEVTALLDAVFAERDSDHWLERLRAADIPCGPVNALDEALRDPQVLHRGMIVDFVHPMGHVKVLGSPLHLADTPVSYRRRPPLLGEHTDEVVAEAARGHLHAIASGARGPAAAGRRPPRWATERALAVEHRGARCRTTTLNVSRGGCALRWNGPFPDVGDELAIELAGLPAGRARAVVRWSLPRGPGERTVGLRVIGERSEVSAWHALVDDVVGSGACAA
jgi:crotonobetainyl-CoA:carnitine CoA-transferase CaiB-like acyl-CoA transferase